jgi:hypothetical protein
LLAKWNRKWLWCKYRIWIRTATIRIKWCNHKYSSSVSIPWLIVLLLQIVYQTCLPLRFWRKAHNFLGYLTPLLLLSISLRFGKFVVFLVPVRHFIADPYIIDRIGISSY